MQPQVQAQAVCDPGAFEVADRIHEQAFLVTVTGQLTTGDPLPERQYEIAADCERTAAFAGIRLYELEMQRVN